MLVIYFCCLIVGGALLVISLVTGGPDGHAHDASGLDGYDSGDHHGLPGWLGMPLSLSFWTFFAAFFGLTGVALTWLALAPAAVVGAIAAVMGIGSGAGVTQLLRWLWRQRVDSSMKSSDFIGALGTVLLPVAPGQPGKVRLQVKGRAVDCLAHSEGETFGAREQVVVYDVAPDGTVRIVSADEGRGGANRVGSSLKE